MSEERRTMHPGDAERLESLEFYLKDAAKDLEFALEIAERAASRVDKCRAIHARRLKERDEFRAAMEGMGYKTK